MPNPETFVRVYKTFREQERRNGGTHPDNLALALAGPQDDNLRRELADLTLRMPTRPHMYTGAEATVGFLFAQGDEVMIWTKGVPKTQVWKVGLSGLGKVRHGLPREEQRRLSVYAADDKVKPLGDLINGMITKGSEEVFIVDDKSSNILDVASHIDDLISSGAIPAEIPITPVWIRQGRTKDEVPNGYTQDTFMQQFTTIDDISQLRAVREQAGSKKVGWLIDFDHTLLNTGAAQNALQNEIARAIDRKKDPSPKIEKSFVGYKGIQSVDFLTSGMSGGKVLLVRTNAGDAVVIKYNTEFPEKIAKEAAGYELLGESLLASKLLKPRSTSAEHGVVVLPYFHGEQLRTGLRDHTLPSTVVEKTIKELMKIKQEWWSNQKKIKQGERTLTSMQRTEWADTQMRLDQTLALLESKTGIPVEVLQNYPLALGEHQYPSLADTVASVETTLKEAPPYTILTHGDATGANIIVNPQTEEWKLIDAEWTGYGDPAEAYSRLIKYISTTTAYLDSIKVKVKNNRLNLSISATFDPTAISLQEDGLKYAEAFGESLGDPDFHRRVTNYLGGSYLREFALAQARGNVELGFLAMIKAAEAINGGSEL